MAWRNRKVGTDHEKYWYNELVAQENTMDRTKQSTENKHNDQKKEINIPINTNCYKKTDPDDPLECHD